MRRVYYLQYTIRSFLLESGGAVLPGNVRGFYRKIAVPFTCTYLVRFSSPLSLPPSSSSSSSSVFRSYFFLLLSYIRKEKKKQRKRGKTDFSVPNRWLGVSHTRAFTGHLTCSGRALEWLIPGSKHIHPLYSPPLTNRRIWKLGFFCLFVWKSQECHTSSTWCLCNIYESINELYGKIKLKWIKRNEAWLLEYGISNVRC